MTNNQIPSKSQFPNPKRILMLESLKAGRPEGFKIILAVWRSSILAFSRFLFGSIWIWDLGFRDRIQKPGC